jgi:hypothetical protein
MASREVGISPLSGRLLRSHPFPASEFREDLDIQQCVFPRIGGNGLTYGTPAQLGPGSKRPFTISEATIVQAAGRANL